MNELGLVELFKSTVESGPFHPKMAHPRMNLQVLHLSSQVFRTGKGDITQTDMGRLAKVTPWDTLAQTSVAGQAVPLLALFPIPAMLGMQISLKTKLGNCKLSIGAQLRKLDDAAMTKLLVKALQFIIWHEVPAKAFAKDEPFKRDAAYSPELEKHLIKHSKALMETFFENISFETALYEKTVKAVDYAKLTDEQKAKIREQVLAEIAAESKATKPVETVEAVAA